MEDYRNRIKKSIERYAKKELPKQKAKRSHPELLVQNACQEWFDTNGFDMTIIDSGYEYLNQSKVSEIGYSDSSGNVGALAVYVEFKAKGSLRNLSENQYRFLYRKIMQGCFAVCVDSSELLDSLWRRWKAAGLKKKDLLLEVLPCKDKYHEVIDANDSPLFD